MKRQEYRLRWNGIPPRIAIKQWVWPIDVGSVWSRIGSSRASWPTTGIPELYGLFVKWGHRQNEGKPETKVEMLWVWCVLDTALSHFPIPYPSTPTPWAIQDAAKGFLLHKRVEFASPKSHVLELRQEVSQALCNPRGHHAQCLSWEWGAMELSKVQPYWVTWRKWLRFICLTSVIYEENPTVVRTAWH